MRNPYHMGYYMWNHIEDLYRKGKVSLSFTEEQIRETKTNWNVNGTNNPIEKMDHLVKTITDYEFIRRFLDKDLIDKLYLNRLTHNMAAESGFLNPENENLIYRADKNYVYLSHDYVKNEMLEFFSDFFRPMIYVIDTDFQDGGLLLYHKHKGRDLKTNWIPPTLGNINTIWKSPAYLITGNMLFKASEKDTTKIDIKPIDFETIRERMFKNEKPFKLE
jgi:stage V sporulation protein R